jgi:hypothetical protein
MRCWRLHWLHLRQALWHEGHHHHLRRAIEKTMMTCLHQHVGTRGLHRHLRRLHQHRLRQTPFTGGPLQTSSTNHNDMPPPTLHRCLRRLAFIAKLEGLCQLLQHRGIPHLRPPLRLEGPSATWVWTSTSTSKTTSTTPRTMEDLVTSIDQEGLGDHTEGPDTPRCEVFYPMLVSEDLRPHIYLRS